MTLDELEAKCDATEANFKTLGVSNPDGIQLLLHRIPKGNIVRLAPGLTAKVLETRLGNTSLCIAKISDVRKYIAKVKASVAIDE